MQSVFLFGAILRGFIMQFRFNNCKKIKDFHKLEPKSVLPCLHRVEIGHSGKEFYCSESFNIISSFTIILGLVKGKK